MLNQRFIDSAIDRGIISPRFIDTVEAALFCNTANKIFIVAKNVLQTASSLLLGSKNRSEMNFILANEMSDVRIATDTINAWIRVNGPIRMSTNILEKAKSRGVSDDVIDRIRLGLLASDSECLHRIPGGINSYQKLWEADARSRLLLMTITKWTFDDVEEPAIWNDLTYMFLDSAGQTFGLATSLIAEFENQFYK